MTEGETGQATASSSRPSSSNGGGGARGGRGGGGRNAARGERGAGAATARGAGRGGGRGRHGGGRGGRGRNAQGTTDAPNSKDTTHNIQENKSNEHNNQSSNSNNNNWRDNNNRSKESPNNAATDNAGSETPVRGGGGRSEGRGRGRGRSAGRGRSRGRGAAGRGRAEGGGRQQGGRGRGGRQNNRSNSPSEETEIVLEDDAPNNEYASNTESLLLGTATIMPLPTIITTTATTAAAAVVVKPPMRSLPLPPTDFGAARGGVPMILSRHSHPPDGAVTVPVDVDVDVVDHDAEAQKLSERLAAAALEEDDDDNDNNDGQEEKKDTTEESNHNDYSNSNSTPAPTTKQKPERKKKKKHALPASPLPLPEETFAVEISTTDALKALPGKEVSITAATSVQIRREESEVDLNKMEGDFARSTKKGAADIATSKSKKKKPLSKDHAANQRAARAFNKNVRTCVERSDPDAMRVILHDRHNHNFALDNTVLETVMKAYVMAAMFEDALYCLRNCTLPGTLSTLQTERILICLPQNLRNSSAYTAADMINAICIATKFDNPTSRTYFLRIVRGISLEFLEEVMSARDRICSAPCDRLVRASVCVVDARLRRGKKPTELLVVPGEQLGVFIPDTMENRGIQAGDAVSLLPYAGPYPMSAESLDRNMIEATVTNTNPMVLRLQDKSNANLHAMLTEPIEGNVYRIDKLANRMGFNRQLASAVAIASPLGDGTTRDPRRPSPELIKAITAMDENIEQVMKNSGQFSFGELTSTAALCAEAVPWRFQDEEAGEDGPDQDALRMASTLALEKYGALQSLNASQRMAVEGAVTNRLTLVQGPPGTGKTAVAIRILQHWARLAAADTSKGDNHSPILATSDSNIAVDNLVEGCAAAGLRVVRLGRPEAIRPELLRFCVDRPPSSYSKGENNQQSGGSSAMAFKERMKHLKSAQVICCTCIGSGGDILDTITFDRILVDEATQATEPAVLVPLMRGCRQLVLVGDHCQLPPTVLSTKAEEEGHGVPLFSRMVACGVPPFMLDTQYRMHPCIAMFPSDLFYGGKLLNGVSAPERRPLAGFPWPREEFPVAFVPVKGVEMDDGVSKMNEAEAAAACDAVAALLEGGQCLASDIAVVTPYAAQARLIRRMTRRLAQNRGPPFVEVSSVDGFQGREKEAVVFSAVRSNDYGAIGFTSDWRRVNVSFTRARRALIVIGNDTTLRRGDPETWGPWLAWADAHGLNMDKPGVPRGRYEPEQLRKVRGGTTAAEMLKDVLARQQAQLKKAEKQLAKANKNAEGHIIGNSDDDDDGPTDKGNVDTEKPLSLEEDLARLANADGNWDDSDDEGDVDLHRSVSQPTLTSLSSSNDRMGSDDDVGAPVDVWDL
jgi:hypothetical protein